MRSVQVLYQGSKLTANLLLESPEEGFWGDLNELPPKTLVQILPLLLLHGGFS